MKILHVIHRFLPEAVVGGTTTYLQHLCKEQAGRHEVRVFCGGSPRADGVLQEEIVCNDISIIKAFPKNQHWKWSVSNQEVNKIFESVLVKVSPDVVHFHDIMLLSNDLPLIAKQRSIPSLFTLHDLWFDCLRIYPEPETIRWIDKNCSPFKRFRCYLCLRHFIKDPSASLKNRITTHTRALLYALYQRPHAMRRLFDAVDLFVAPSEWIRDYYITNGFPGKKIVFSGYGLEIEQLRNIGTTPSDKMRFGYFGGKHPAKGLSVLLEAFKQISGKAELRIYGEYEDSLILSLQDDKNIVFAGSVTGERKLAAFSAVDVIIVPSIVIDNSPLIIHEARAAGIPAIGSRAGGIPELIEEGTSGFTFERGNASDLREKMLFCMRNSERLAAMRQSITPYKTIQQNAQELDLYYKQIMR